jgi:diguanylate cyclase (GGDEF)-like protein
MPALAVSAGVSAMAAQSIGAGRWDRLAAVTRAGIVANVAMTGVLVALLLLGLGWITIAASDNRRRALAALAAAEARWKLALNAAGEGVWDWDIRAGQVTLSSRAQTLLKLGSPVVAAKAEMLNHCVHADDLDKMKEALQAHLDGRSPDFVAEARVHLPGNDWPWVLVRGMVVERDKQGRPLRMVGTFADIDGRKNEEERIRYLAHHDALTGLPNRLLFADRLNQAMRMAQRDGANVGVLYFDLDKFKPVNDTYGHEVGDRLLQQVAVRVGAALRDSDTLCRVGGDEFVALLPHCGRAADVRRIAEHVLALLNEEFRVQEHVLHISGSIGYAVYPDCGARSDAEVMRCADQAMYYAKEHGRGQVSGVVRDEPAQADAVSAA